MKRFLLFLALIGIAFAVPHHMKRIVGGQGTSVEAYPYISNMQYHMLNMIWSHWCGGSLITSKTVLSAAHCYDGDAPTSWRVFLGSSRSNGLGGSLHPVSEITIHEHFDKVTLNANVAIIRLSVAAVYGPTIRVARLPANVYNVADGSAVHAVGWGNLYYEGPQSEQLQHVQLYTINQKVCTERYDFLRTQPGFEYMPGVTPGMICAGILDQGGRDSCHGDAGGPLAHLGDIILGITSWGYRCGDNFYPGVNVRVSHYTDWIVKAGAS